MAYNDDEKPLAPISGSKEGLVTMKIPMYSKKDVSLAEDQVTTLLEIEATSSADVREGLDLVVVLDVSDSMKHGKIVEAQNALQWVIMKLNPLDRLSVVTFNGSAERLTPLQSMTPAGQEVLMGTVSCLQPGGETDIKSGLVMGLDVLAGRVHTESRTANIFLICGGKNKVTNSGDPTEVNPGDVGVYTFGFGSGEDVDNELLIKLAKNSTGGTYNSVPESSCMNLTKSLAQLLAGLVTVVAQEVRFTLTPVRGPDFEEMTVAGGNDYKQTTDANGLITINFGNLFSGEVRRVVVDFKLKNREKEPIDLGATTLAVAEHSYAAQERRQSPMNVRVQRTRNPTPPDSAGIEERTVKAELQRRQHAEFIRKASTLAHAKRLEEAREEVAEGQKAIEDVVPDLSQERTLNVLRAELLELYVLMGRQTLYDHLGHPYALATIISHDRQRTAGRGNDEKDFSLYITPRMVTYLQFSKEGVMRACNALPNLSAPLVIYVDQAIHALGRLARSFGDTTSSARPARANKLRPRKGK